MGRPTEPLDWSIGYRNRLFASDILVVVWAVFGSEIVWLGSTENDVSISGAFANLPLSYTAVSTALSLAWIIFLSASASRDTRVVGIGTAEYRRITNSSLMLFGLLAIACYLLKIELARGYFATALPAGLAALLLSRWIWRQWLVSRRVNGTMAARVILLGSEESAVHIAEILRGSPAAGYIVVGAVTPNGRAGTVLGSSGVPILGTISDALDAMESIGADTVVVTSTAAMSPTHLRNLSWSLEPGRRHLVVAPGLTNIAGPRIHARPVSGLPLIHVETPRYEGARKLVKRVFDVVASTALLLVLSMPLVLIALTVKLTSPGPIIFRQSRVGINGKPFDMLKFRSMVEDAELRLNELVSDGASSPENQIMFKMSEDPRVTGVGRFLRRFSLDELPQLANVLNGSMSLVGPRPPLMSEVAHYESHVNRRFLVTPGITGLWQVSGRSDLSWEDTVRLDLYYVENWTFVGDLVILWRTIRAVTSRQGAY